MEGSLRVARSLLVRHGILEQWRSVEPINGEKEELECAMKRVAIL